MEIKQFKVISTSQKKELYNFIKSTDLTYSKTYIEMHKIYESDTFNEGNSVFVLFHNGQIKGSLAVITKEINIKGEAFITDIYIERENRTNEAAYLNTEIYLRFLIERAIDYCNSCSARSIKIGIRESEMHLSPYIEAIEFTHIYDAVIMKYCGDKNKASKINKDIELAPLSILNSNIYMDIQNEAFRNSPNGGTIDELEVKDYIVQYANNEDLIGIGYYEENPCGIYELSLDGNIGWIDTLAVAPKYQKKGLGKALIRKCINRLWEKDVNEIKLLVITSNDIAVKMYKENGFEEEKVFSYWFKKTFKKFV